VKDELKSADASMAKEMDPIIIDFSECCEEEKSMTLLSKAYAKALQDILHATLTR
jgi:hypothetical protein